METTIAKSKPAELKVSEMAEHLIGSEILKIAAEVNEKIKKGQKIYNFTVGDFDSNIFPLPDELKAYIIEAYQNKYVDLIVLMTGGNALLFEKRLKQPIFVIGELNLIGLNRILNHNV